MPDGGTFLRADAAVPMSRAHRIIGRPGQNDRPALPPGDPITWGAITRGTILDGLKYPVPLLGNRPLALKRECDKLAG